MRATRQVALNILQHMWRGQNIVGIDEGDSIAAVRNSNVELVHKCKVDRKETFWRPGLYMSRPPGT